LHFGHTEQFAVFDIEDGKIVNEKFAIPPEHEYGSHPRFIKEIGCDVILAGGMGIKAQELMKGYDIEIIIGVEKLPPRELVNHYINGTLKTGMNRCDH
jgi:predicted Fe-Mo cluster-binding NifX family protein